MSFTFDDEWDALELTTPRASPTSEISGELEVLSGGGAKSVSLFFVDAAVDVQVCWGLVGSGKAKFCIKPCIHGTVSCGTFKHGGSKFTADDQTFYIRSGDSQAFCSPCLPSSVLSQRQKDVLRSSKHTAAEWATMFNSMMGPSSTSLLIETQDGSTKGVERLPGSGQLLEIPVGASSEGKGGLLLETPKLVSKNVGIFAQTPVMPMSEDLYSSSKLVEAKEEWEANNVPTSLIYFLSQIHDQLCLIKEGWPAPFRDIEGSFMMMTKDLEGIFEICRRLQGDIGDSAEFTGEGPSSLWSGLNQVMETMEKGFCDLRLQLKQEMRDDFNSKMDTLSNLETSFAELTQGTLDTAHQLKIHSRRFEQIKPFLIEFKQITEQATRGAPDWEHVTKPLQEEMKRLKRQIDRVEHRSSINTGDDVWLGSTTATATPAQIAMPSRDVEDKIQMIQAQLQLLEKRVIGKGVSMGNYVFQSFEELATWVITHVPQNRFGLFVDGVSLFEFFAYDHTDTDMFMTTSHNTQKNSFNTLFEARIATSMQNLFPTMFGKASSTGMDPSEFLPALTDPDKWDLNGVTGLKHQIDREILNVDFSIESTINKRLQDYHDARQIARDCLFKAKRFVLELSNFMSQDYAAWKYRGYTKKDAWRITCVSVRRIFEDIHAVRVSARDIRDITDATYTTAQYIWATLKAHEVMEEYMRRQFYEHPSVSAVLARHLASNHLKPDDKIDARVKRLEEDFKKLATKVDKIESRLALLEKNGKAGAKNEKP